MSTLALPSHPHVDRQPRHLQMGRPTPPGQPRFLGWPSHLAGGWPSRICLRKENKTPVPGSQDRECVLGGSRSFSLASCPWKCEQRCRGKHTARCQLPEDEDASVPLPPASTALSPVSCVRGFVCELVCVGHCLVAGAQGSATVATLCLSTSVGPGCAALHPGLPGQGRVASAAAGDGPS